MNKTMGKFERYKMKKAIKKVSGYMIKHSEGLPSERDDLLQVLLSGKISDAEHRTLIEAILRSELDQNQRDRLFGYLCAQPLGEKEIADFVQALDNTKPGDEQRSLLFSCLLKQPLPPETLPLLIEALADVRPCKEQRAFLFSCLLKQPLPPETLPLLINALTDTRPDKEQRMILLSYLLKQPLPLEMLPALSETLARTDLTKEDRIVLLEHLLKQPLSPGILPFLVDVLVQEKIDKQQREKLIKTVLNYPFNEKDIISFLSMIAEKETGAKHPQVGAMAKRLCEYRETERMLLKWVDTERPAWKEQYGSALYKTVVEGEPVEDVFLDMLCEGNMCYLTDACIEFIDRKRLWLMFKEILFEEEYNCEFASEEPYIIDCGVNIGLAIYYAKHRYPKAKIVGFEPWSVAYECAQRNIERNGWKDVTLFKAALGPKESTMQLVSMRENSLASTLTARMDRYIENNHIEKLVEDVRVVPLSQYIDRPVDFLKMDIEGMEAQVLCEAESTLNKVEWLFCEYHYGPDIQDNSLAEILKILEEKDFSFEVSKSHSFYESTKGRAFSHVGKIVSELIWARKQVCPDPSEDGQTNA